MPPAQNGPHAPNHSASSLHPSLSHQALRIAGHTTIPSIEIDEGQFELPRFALNMEGDLHRRRTQQPPNDNAGTLQVPEEEYENSSTLEAFYILSEDQVDMLKDIYSSSARLTADPNQFVPQGLDPMQISDNDQLRPLTPQTMQALAVAHEFGTPNKATFSNSPGDDQRQIESPFNLRFGSLNPESSEEDLPMQNSARGSDWSLGGPPKRIYRPRAQDEMKYESQIPATFDKYLVDPQNPNEVAKFFGGPYQTTTDRWPSSRKCPEEGLVNETGYFEDPAEFEAVVDGLFGANPEATDKIIAEMDRTLNRALDAGLNRQMLCSKRPPNDQSPQAPPQPRGFQKTMPYSQIPAQSSSRIFQTPMTAPNQRLNPEVPMQLQRPAHQAPVTVLNQGLVTQGPLQLQSSAHKTPNFPPAGYSSYQGFMEPRGLASQAPNPAPNGSPQFQGLPNAPSAMSQQRLLPGGYSSVGHSSTLHGTATHSSVSVEPLAPTQPSVLPQNAPNLQGRPMSSSPQCLYKPVHNELDKSGIANSSDPPATSQPTPASAKLPQNTEDEVRALIAAVEAELAAPNPPGMDAAASRKNRRRLQSRKSRHNKKLKEIIAKNAGSK